MKMGVYSAQVVPVSATVALNWCPEPGTKRDLDTRGYHLVLLRSAEAHRQVSVSSGIPLTTARPVFLLRRAGIC